ncbi:MAG: PHP domain-containing protein [Oscillospiraceae bacterium]|nr:PHP domain-containing protein [Oscillospiraceae bacterium]
MGISSVLSQTVTSADVGREKYKYETHMHTSEVSACASATAVEQVREYKRRGYAGIIITNHFINSYVTHAKDLPWAKLIELNSIGYHEAKKEGDKCGLDVFFGFEYSIDGLDFLTYGVSIDCLLANPGIDKLDVAQYSQFVRDNGGYLAQAHPYREAYYIPEPYPVMPQWVDGIEVYNVSMPDTVNEKAFIFAEQNNLGMIAGSDSHHLGMKFLSGITLNKRAENISDIIDALKTREIGLILP